MGRLRCILLPARNENAGETIVLRRVSRGILPLAAKRDGARPRRSTSPGPSPLQDIKPYGADMPQYFFNLTNGETVRDDQGTRCDTLEDVRTYALAVAAELGRNRSPEELSTLSLCVIDETGQEVFRTKVVNMQTAPNAEAITRAVRNEQS